MLEKIDFFSICQVCFFFFFYCTEDFISAGFFHCHLHYIEAAGKESAFRQYLIDVSGLDKTPRARKGNFYHGWKPDRAPLKEVLGGQYNYREGGRQVLRQAAG